MRFSDLFKQSHVLFPKFPRLQSSCRMQLWLGFLPQHVSYKQSCRYCYMCDFCSPWWRDGGRGITEEPGRLLCVPSVPSTGCDQGMLALQ